MVWNNLGEVSLPKDTTKFYILQKDQGSNHMYKKGGKKT